MVRVVMAVMALTFPACQQQAQVPATPEAAYQRFAEALRGHDPKTAWALLSPSTRAAAEARSKAVAAASQGMVRDEPMIMVLQSGVMPVVNIGEITVVKQTGQNAVLEVGAPNHRQQVAMVKENGAAWAVDLSEAFSKEAAK